MHEADIKHRHLVRTCSCISFFSRTPPVAASRIRENHLCALDNIGHALKDVPNAEPTLASICPDLFQTLQVHRTAGSNRLRINSAPRFCLAWFERHYNNASVTYDLIFDLHTLRRMAHDARQVSPDVRLTIEWEKYLAASWKCMHFSSVTSHILFLFLIHTLSLSFPR